MLKIVGKNKYSEFETVSLLIRILITYWYISITNHYLTYILSLALMGLKSSPLLLRCTMYVLQFSKFLPCSDIDDNSRPVHDLFFYISLLVKITLQ